MFDFNRNGKLDSFERIMEFGFIQSLDKEVSDEIHGEENEELTELEGQVWIRMNLIFSMNATLNVINSDI